MLKVFIAVMRYIWSGNCVCLDDCCMCMLCI